MFFIRKLLSRLFFPISLVVELIIAGFIVLRLGKRRLGYGLCAASLALLTIASIHPVADAFLWTLEGRYTPVTRIESEEVEFIVVLASSHSERAELSGTQRLSPASMGRVTEAIRLAACTPGAKVLFTGGIISGERALSAVAAEAAGELGLDRARIVTESSSRNTAEEARAATRLVGDARVLLVTSASHMHRALQLFHAAGVNAVPAPADFRASGGPYGVWSLIPSAGALEKTERAWYEYMGLLWNAVWELIVIPEGIL